MSSPTLEEWAAYVGPRLSAAGWSLANSDDRDRRLVVDFLFRMMPTLLFRASMQDSGPAFAALLAHRDRVVAGLNDEQRHGLIGVGVLALALAPGFEWMRDQGIVDGGCELTNFGRECARVLQGGCDGK